MTLVMKKNFINHKIYIGMFISIVSCMKKKPYTCKNISPTFKRFIFIFQSSQILGPIQVLVNSVKIYDYNNIAFEVYANKN